MRAELDEIVSRVRAIVNGSAIAPDIAGIEVDPENGSDIPFLRIMLASHHPGRLTWQRMAPVVRAIQDEIMEIDERFPSVRIAEAA